MVTHYKPLNSDLEKEIDELDSYLNQHKIVGLVNKKIHGKSGNWKYYGEETHLIEGEKYFRYKIFATEYAENLEDFKVRKF